MSGEQWEGEIQTLSAIFMDEVEVISDDSIKVKVINEESVFSSATLAIKCTDKDSYPTSRAIVSVLDLAISDENLSYITNKLQKLIDDNLGYSMIFDVIELLRGELQLISKFDSQGLFTHLAKETILAILYECEISSIWSLICTSKIFSDYMDENLFKYFYNLMAEFECAKPPNGLNWRDNCKFFDFNHRHILRYAIPFLERRGLPDPIPNESNWIEILLKELQLTEPRISYVCSRVYLDDEKRYSIIFNTQKSVDLEHRTYKIGSIQFFSNKFSKKKSLFPIVLSSPKRDCLWSGQDAILGWCNVEFEPLYDNSEGQQLLKTLLYFARGSLLKTRKNNENSITDRNNVEIIYCGALRYKTLENIWFHLCDPLKQKSVVFNVKYSQATGKVIFAQLSKKKKSSITYHLLSSFSDTINLNEVDQDNLLKDNSYLYTIISNIVHECKQQTPALKKNVQPQIMSLEVSLNCWICDVVLYDKKERTYENSFYY